jgi:mannose-6-phosphate isomerase-like protein (cupin superfamily)
MSKKTLAIVSIGFLFVMLSPLAITQTTPAVPAQTSNNPAPGRGGRGGRSGGGTNSFAEPSLIRYVPARDIKDRRVDMFMSDWHESMPRAIHGSLVARDILTKGDKLAPAERGAILERKNFLTRATLAAHASTTRDRLVAQQELFYIVGGTGTITAGGTMAELHKDVAVAMPANLEFLMKNDGDQPLTMYILNVPVPENYKGADKMLAVEERQAPFRAPAGNDPYIVKGASGHWAHVVRELFAGHRDGYVVGGALTVELLPMTIGEPHPHGLMQEEIWLSLEGTSLAWMSAELRLQRPGMAFMIRPDTQSTHSSVNFGDTIVKFLWL